MSDQLNSRLDALRAQMLQAGVDLVALGPTNHMKWLTGLSPHGDERPVMVLVSQQFCGVLMPALNSAACRNQTSLPFFQWADHEGPQQALSLLIAECGVPNTSPVVALDEIMRADFALLLLDQFTQPEHQFLDHTVGYLRTIKDENERAFLTESARINDVAFQAAFDALQPGMTELELCAVVKAAHIANGATHGFCSVCFGENSAYPHHSPGDTRLQTDMAVLIDAGCKVNGYNSDMTRCGWFGTPPEDYIQIASNVERALDAGIAKSAVNIQACEIDNASREVIAAAGYGEYFTHRTGHGLGLDIHEAPYLTAASQETLRAGNVFTVEPGIYLPERFGIRLEDDIFLHEDRVETLSKFPRLTVIS